MHGKHGLIKMDELQALVIIGIILLVGVFFGGATLWIRVSAALTSLGELFISVGSALEDGNIDADEIDVAYQKALDFLVKIQSIKSILFK